jgi:ParB family chromosome partitioning protein
MAQSSQKKRLGRGLSSLISNPNQVPPAPSTRDGYESQATPGSAGDTKSAVVNGVPREIDVERISPNPLQPRREFAEEELRDLARSIEAQGVLQPLIVAPARQGGEEESFTLIAGERRLRAAKLAGLRAVPCVIRRASSQQMLEWALIENLQREDLNPIERARAYQEYIQRFSLTQAQAGERLGEPRATIANHLRLLELESEMQQMVIEGDLSFGHAKLLAGASGDPERQREWARTIVAEGLSVRQAEQLIAAAQQQEAKTDEPQQKRARAKAAYIQDLEERLTASVGTRVRILPGRGKHSGRIVVEYYNLDDFDRISSALGLPAE